ncbi:Lyso-phosphatidylcholine acyltransferase [Saxophila tyrrhenica]|uniref:Tafazzin family protein n=1 Tax=Saxophila tyrrhenica TaxID=1690608 RepID=A0AAV9PLK4_9PEZI|nr:Lyso-phosphatidylcholine acyltransferase [Saxophila tyrrhenica]
MRWSLGSYDICFKNGQYGMLSKFFTYGNTLPTQRSAHSKYGGLFQPTMTECIRLLSDPRGGQSSSPQSQAQRTPSMSLPPSDPFSASTLTYSTNGLDSFPAPAAYPSRRHSWLHIFPEGMIHQHPCKTMRYFKWGVARLILEAEPCPDVLPMWIDGPQEVMSEKRTFPRPLPRPGKHVEVTFGELVDREGVLEPLRRRWQTLKERARRKPGREGWEMMEVDERLGVVDDDFLRYGPEAEKLRIEVTLAVRNEVLKVRRQRGLPDEDPKRGLAETFKREGPKREGEMADRSVVKDM